MLMKILLNLHIFVKLKKKKINFQNVFLNYLNFNNNKYFFMSLQLIIFKFD